MCIGINTNRGALSLVKDNGAFQTKFNTIEDARIAAKGNATNQTLKKGNEAIVKNDDGTFSLHYLTNETDPAKKAAAEKALIDMARKGDTSQFNPKIVEFSLSSAFDSNIKIEKPTAQPLTPVEVVQTPTTQTPPTQNTVGGSDTTVTDNMIKLPDAKPLSSETPFSFYDTEPLYDPFAFKLDLLDNDFLGLTGTNFSNTFGGYSSFCGPVNYGSTSNSNSSELNTQANAIVTKPNSIIKDSLPADTAIKSLDGLPDGLKKFIEKKYSDDLGQVNKDLSAAVARFNKGEKLSDLDLILLSKPIKDASNPPRTPEVIKELTELSSLSDKITENYNNSSGELIINSADKIAEIASDDVSFQIGNTIMGGIIAKLGPSQDQKIKEIQKIRTILADQSMLSEKSTPQDISKANKAKIDKLVAPPYNMTSLSKIDPKLLENDPYFFSNQIMQIDRVIKGFETGTDEAVLMANAMSLGIKVDDATGEKITVEKIKEVSDQKISIIMKNKDETEKTLETKTKELSSYISGNPAVKDSLIALGSGNIDLKTLDQDILASLRRSAIADIKSRNIKVETGKLSETVDAMIQSQIKESIAKLSTPNAVLSTGDTLRLAMLSNQLPAENKTEIDALKSKGQDLSKRLDYVNKNNIIIANIGTAVSQNTSEIFGGGEKVNNLGKGSIANSNFGNITEDSKNKINSYTSEMISLKGMKGMDLHKILPNVDSTIKNYNELINNPSTSPDLKASAKIARDSWQSLKDEATSSSKDSEKIKSLLAEAVSNNEKVIGGLNTSEKAELAHILQLNTELTDIKNIISEGDRRLAVKVSNLTEVANNSEYNPALRQIAQEASDAFKVARAALSDQSLSSSQRHFIVRTAELKEKQFNVIKDLSLLGIAATDTDRNNADEKFQQLQSQITRIALPDNATKDSSGVVTLNRRSQGRSESNPSGDVTPLHLPTVTSVTSNSIKGDPLNDLSPRATARLNDISKENEDITQFAAKTDLWNQPDKLVEKQQEIKIAYEKASPNVKAVLGILAATSMPELKDSIPALRPQTSNQGTSSGAKDLSVDAQMRSKLDTKIKNAENAEGNFNDTIDSSAANVSTLLKAFRDIIVKLDMDLLSLKNSVNGRTQIDRKFSESLKENRARWDQLDKAKDEYQQHFKSSTEVQRPTLPPSLEKAFDKLDAARVESSKISVKLEVLTNQYNRAIESGQKPDARLISDLNNQVSIYSANEKKNDKLFSDLERLMSTPSRV